MDAEKADLVPLLLLPFPPETSPAPLMALLSTAPEMRVDPPQLCDNRYLGYLLRWCFLLSSPVAPQSDWIADSFTVPAQDISRKTRRLGRIPFACEHILFSGPEHMWLSVFRRVWSAFSKRAQRDNPSARFHVEMTDTTVLDALGVLGIAAKRIYLVRDLRDEFTHLWNRRLRTGIMAPKMADKETHHTFATRWLDARTVTAARMLAKAAREDELVVRYESLISDPESTASDLGKRIGVKFSAASMPEVPMHLRVRPGSIGAWRQQMPEPVKALFEAKVGESLRALGYD